MCTEKRVWFVTSDFLVVLTHHVYIYCVTWHDNHVVSFAYTRTCAERDRYLYFIMSNLIELAYPFSEHGDSAQPRNVRTMQTLFRAGAREGLGTRLDAHEQFKGHSTVFVCVSVSC